MTGSVFCWSDMGKWHSALASNSCSRTVCQGQGIWVNLEVWSTRCSTGQWNLLLQCPGKHCVAYLTSTATDTMLSRATVPLRVRIFSIAYFDTILCVWKLHQILVFNTAKKSPIVCYFSKIKKEIMFHEEWWEGTHCCDTGVLALFKGIVFTEFA